MATLPYVTPVYATTHTGENNLWDLIPDGYIRIPDSIVGPFPFIGWQQDFVIAFEDHTDFDFNDLVLHCVPNNCVKLYEQAAASHTFSIETLGDGWYVKMKAYHPSIDVQNATTLGYNLVDRAVIYGKREIDPVPEPTSVALLGGALILATMFRKFRRK